MTRIKVEHLTDEQKKHLKIPDKPRSEHGWTVWECGPTAFEWHYDEKEKAYIYEGEVKVITPKGVLTIKGGDYVTFPVGMKCRWEVHKKVRKVYRFE